MARTLIDVDEEYPAAVPPVAAVLGPMIEAGLVATVDELQAFSGHADGQVRRASVARSPRDEFDARVSQTFASRTYAGPALVTTDIPAALTAAPPPLRPGPAKASPPTHANLTPGERAIMATGLLAALALVVALLAGGSVGGLLVLGGWAALSCPRSSSEPRYAAHGAIRTPAVTCVRSGQLTAVRELAARRHLLPRQNRSRTPASLGGAATLTLPCAMNGPASHPAQPDPVGYLDQVAASAAGRSGNYTG